MIQSEGATRKFVIVFDGDVLIDADHHEDDGENLTFWDELGVLVAKIPKKAIWTYSLEEVEVVA